MLSDSYTGNTQRKVITTIDVIYALKEKGKIVYSFLEVNERHYKGKLMLTNDEITWKKNNRRGK